MYFTELLNDLNRVQGQLRLQNGLWNGLSHGSIYGTHQSEYPLIQIYADKDFLTLRAEVPGVALEDLSITITDDVLTLNGEIKESIFDANVKALRKERVTGKFFRTVELPYPVESDKAEAVLKNGLLNLTLPIKEAVKPRQISIKSE